MMLFLLSSAVFILAALEYQNGRNTPLGLARTVRCNISRGHRTRFCNKSRLITSDRVDDLSGEIIFLAQGEQEYVS